MRKITLFMLMAVGLLVSGNAWAVNQENGHAVENVGVDVAKMDVDKGGVITTTFYATLQDAFDDLPENSFPATLTILKNTETAPINTSLTLNQYQNVTIDLNGCKVHSNLNNTKSTAVIVNYGKLTIKDGSLSQTGLLAHYASNPDVNPIPSYANNLISNYGSLIIEGGSLDNKSQGSACFVIDQSNSSKDVSTIINGGKILHQFGPAIRLTTFVGHENDIVVNDGFIGGLGAIWVQPCAENSNANVTINGGILRYHQFNDCSWIPRYCTMQDLIYISSGGGTKYNSSNIHFQFNGGQLDGRCVLYDSYCNATWEVTNGEFNGGFYDESSVHTNTITGGYFRIYKKVLVRMALLRGDNLKPFQGEKPEELNAFHSIEDLEAAGYLVKQMYYAAANVNLLYIFKDTYESNLEQEYIEDIDFRNHYDHDIYREETIEDNDEYTLVQIVPKSNEVLNVDAGEINLSEQEITLDETTGLTIVPNSASDGTTIINIDEDTKVNDIKVTTTDATGEAQIVVKNGVTLDVGNGGVVSENNFLTTILVETGGTLIIGTGGIDKEGNATPIEIKASEKDGTGVLIFSPNAKHEDTKKYAEVDLYTYCKKVNDKYYWQQFTIPVTGIGTTEKLKPVVNPVTDTYMFKWDYSIYGWSPLNEWKELTTPFAGYDVTNVSPDGGVVYTFKGDLIGNQNIQLTLPHKDYCVMGNSYTAPIDIEALFAQIDKEMNQGTGADQRTIEKTVYKYDAKKGYYVYTNELEIVLGRAGVLDPAFTNIKPMEGFLLNLQSGNTAGVMLNYANAVYTPATTPKPATAPRMNSNTDFVVAKINVSSANTTDLVTLVEGDEFSADIENGKDAFKYLNEGANLYAFDGTNKLAMVATDNLEGTMFAFQAAEDAEYTLTFDRALNTEYVLIDMTNGNEVAMTEGNTYTFFATPNTLDPARFMVKANAQAPTNMESTKATKVAKGIYTITGQYLGESDQWNAMPQGVYMVNGIKVIK